MKKVLTILLAATMIMTSLTGCANNAPAPVQNARTLPAPAQGTPPPAQGITVNKIAFEIIDPENLPSTQRAVIEKYKTSKGFSYWQEDGNFFIAIFAGEKSTGGYTVDVKSIEDNEGKTNVLIDVIAPQGMATQVISYPYIVIKATGITDNFNIKDTNGDSYSLLYGEK